MAVTLNITDTSDGFPFILPFPSILPSIISPLHSQYPQALPGTLVAICIFMFIRNVSAEAGLELPRSLS